MIEQRERLYQQRGTNCKLKLRRYRSSIESKNADRTVEEATEEVYICGDKVHAHSTSFQIKRESQILNGQRTLEEQIE